MHYLQDVEKRKAKIIEEAKGRYFGKEVKLVSMFEQTWGSTALGFGGIGGAAMTTAYTGIIQAGEETFAVYFHERFAYEVTKPNDHFFKDMEKKEMARRRMASLYNTVEH